MSTITKERIELFIKNPLENGLTRSEQMEVARIALASLEADPIGEVSEKRYGLIMDGTVDLGGKSTYRIIKGEKAMKLFPLGTKFYTAPPAPVSVPAAMEIDDDFDSAFEHGKAVGWNAYRAAMLQAEPVSNSDELPLDYLQGHKDGLEWAAQLAEANHPQTGDWLYDDQIDLARAIRKGPDMPTVQGGNSPVIPDGWISCSERMPVIGELNWRTSFPLLVTCEIGVIPAYYGFVSVNGDRHYGFMESLKYGDDNSNHPQTNEYGLISNVTHWMPLPEPPQEVK
ncbi:DUF551 domain-containing protein [Escherichia coli]|nr:DUF551 domain-containing protein [Escherichia coli]EKM3011171.1 DUF551 domain-containing protein [Escherichia coli]ELR5007973.1 DUF551 domain-containing protein [Escherichia coli]